MKAALLYGKEDIRVEEVSKPTIDDDEILVKVKATFICGTDVRMYKNGHDMEGVEHPIMGHEFSGVVSTVGAQVNGYSEGMRVSVAPNFGCGICDICVSGNTQLCGEMKSIGIKIPGSFAEYVKIPARAVRQGNIVPIPDTLSFEEAALVEPLSCVYNAFQRYSVQSGDTVLVIGAGPIGIFHCLFAKMAGASVVAVNDISESRLEQVKHIDSDIVTISGDLHQKVAEITNNKGMDIVVTANSVHAVQQVALELCGLRGRVMYFGGLPKNNSEIWLDTNHIHYKELTIMGTTMQNLAQYRKCIELLDKGVFSVQQLITGGKSRIDDIAQNITNIMTGIGLKNVMVFE